MKKSKELTPHRYEPKFHQHYNIFNFRRRNYLRYWRIEAITARCTRSNRFRCHQANGGLKQRIKR